MNSFQIAFGTFAPEHDPHVAAKWVLNIVMADGSLEDLALLLTDGERIGGLEGDPGWIIERRDSGPAGQVPAYDEWPDCSNFRIFVDPDAFLLGHPQVFLDRPVFEQYVAQALFAYAAQHPSKTDSLRAVRAAMAPSLRVHVNEIDFNDDCSYTCRGALFTGTAFETDRHGRLLSEESFARGCKEGRTREWYPSGIQRSERYFSHNTLHGPSTSWFESGRLEEQAVYELGIQLQSQTWARDGTPTASFQLTEEHPNYQTLQHLRRAKWKVHRSS